MISFGPFSTVSSSTVSVMRSLSATKRFARSLPRSWRPPNGAAYQRSSAPTCVTLHRPLVAKGNSSWRSPISRTRFDCRRAPASWRIYGNLKATRAQESGIYLAPSRRSGKPSCMRKKRTPARVFTDGLVFSCATGLRTPRLFRRSKRLSGSSVADGAMNARGSTSSAGGLPRARGAGPKPGVALNPRCASVTPIDPFAVRQRHSLGPPLILRFGSGICPRPCVACAAR